MCIYSSVSHLVVSDSSQPNELWPARLLCPWDFSGKNPGLPEWEGKGCHFFLQGIFLI